RKRRVGACTHHPMVSVRPRMCGIDVVDHRSAPYIGATHVAPLERDPAPSYGGSRRADSRLPLVMTARPDCDGHHPPCLERDMRPTIRLRHRALATAVGVALAVSAVIP